MTDPMISVVIGFSCLGIQCSLGPSSGPLAAEHRLGSHSPLGSKVLLLQVSVDGSREDPQGGCLL